MMTANSPLGEIHLPDSLTASYQEHLARLREKRIVERIWERDHTVWRPDPTEIENRLGWLDLPETFRDKVATLPEELSSAMGGGVQDVVLLGMGGSSLCPLVLSECVGASPGFPNLHVLDTTVPSTIGAVLRKIDLAKTLFLVSSKSGGTIEVASGLDFFFEAVSQVVPAPGKHFIAITDPGTGLAELAAEKGFAKIFENPPDIGGRFSALSYFGMVPATLLGLNTEKLFQFASSLAAGCGASDPEKNPGALLGAFLAACSEAGRDKLTVVADPAMVTLGLWIEQLLAESTGKEDRGILPIAQEPLLAPTDYADDRAFAFVGTRKSGSPAPEEFREVGHPVAVIEIQDPLQLGAEFFRWEFATAVASHFIGIHPFDQPDVEESKKLSRAVLKEGVSAEPSSLSFQKLLESIEPGDYFAILAYLEETPELNQALTTLREAILRTKRVATTLGYGPRFLHSTGQYHKGGPNKGVFLQLVEEAPEDIPIPGKDYGFAKLCASQTLGDFQALMKRKRRVARVRVGRDPVEKIRELLDIL